MTAVVRVFAYSRPVRIPSDGNQLHTDSSVTDKNPYLERWNLTATDASAVSTGSFPAYTEYALVQVEPAKRVFFEVNHLASSTAADTSSPYLTGDNRIKLGPNQWLTFREYT
mgnify:CR=1 FL=1